MAELEQLLQVTEVSKAFPGVKALDHVSFELRPGEVHALVGENGAGKSTLIKIISGALHMDSGSLTVRGAEEVIRDAHHARSLGIACVFQELSLIPGLTVAENVFLGNEVSRTSGLLDRKSMFTGTAELFSKYSLELDPRDKVQTLSAARQQLVEVAKALSLDPRILIMDEPTSSLSESETQILFNIIEDLKSKGVGVIFVSHRMDEVFHVADRVTVLRDGKKVQESPTEELDLQKVVKAMVGRAIELYESSAKPRSEIEARPSKLEVRNLTSAGMFSNVSFDLKQGEILGIAGLIGSGRSELAKAVFGIEAYDEGEIYLDGVKKHIPSVKEAIASGIVLLPENTKAQGLILMHNLVDNLTLPILRRFTTRLGLLRHGQRRIHARKQVEQFSIRPGAIDIPVRNLSGGNQQKACISKWLSTEPKLLIVDEPTVGIDVRTKSEIHRLLRTLSDKGVSIIMVSSEMQELLAHSDRVMVMNKGRVLGTFYNEEISQESIMNLIMEDIIAHSKKGRKDEQSIRK